MVGEVDELEEHVGWSISCLEGVMDVEEGKLEEDVVDKPGTIIATCFTCNRRRKSACWRNSWQVFPNSSRSNFGEDITDFWRDCVDVQWLLALVVGGNPSDSPRRSSWTSPRSGYADPCRSGCAQNLIFSNKLYLSICGLRNCCQFGRDHLLRVEPASRCGILTRLFCPLAQRLPTRVPFQTSPPAYQTYLESVSGSAVLPNWWNFNRSKTEMEWYSLQRTK